MNPLIQVLMNQLKNKNSGGFQMLSNLMQNGGNPNEILKQVVGNMSHEQKQTVLNMAKNYGCPDMYLSHIQNMK